MAALPMFGFLVQLCYFLLLLTAATEEFPIHTPFRCGYLGELDFPFTNNTDCGIYISGCDDHGTVKQTRLTNQTWYKIHSINLEPDNKRYSIFMYYPNFESPWYDAPALVISQDSPIMTYFRIRNNFTVSRCIKNKNHDDAGTAFYRECPSYDIYINSSHPDQKLPIFPFACLFVQLPIGQPLPTYPCSFLFSFLHIEVHLNESCEDCYPAKNCRFNQKISTFVPPTDQGKGRDWKPLLIGLTAGLASLTVIALFVILFLYKRKNKYSGLQNQPIGSLSKTTHPESGAVYFRIPIFSYVELQEATNNFDHARELGEGGFGTVYYGKLRDGREVAVKRLFERNYRPVESFINEIQILTRLRHRNLVSLYGCTSRHSRELLLVYEYVPNGTVSCHLHGNRAKPGLLPWSVRMKIAIETATALTYLHASDIIHRDVKTSNILLDNNFGVKVADFGLSRLFPYNVTHVSTAPRGTPGYVDPDYRLCYQLTTKSDVYSFGVVLAELISSMPAVDMTKNRDDIKLANLAIRKIQKREFCELVDPSLGFQSDDKLKKMIISAAELAFQCLQGDKELRPTMDEVLEILQKIESGRDEPGNLEGIEIHGPTASQSYALPNTLMRPQRLHQTQ